MLRVFIAGALLIGCNNDEGPRAYPTYQDCFDDLTEIQKMMVEESIVECCLEHPIDGQKPACGETKPDCVNYLTINLKQTSAGVDQMMNACMTYEQMKDQPNK